MYQKSIIVHVYDKNLSYIGVWGDADFLTFNRQMNGGPSECTLNLARTFDAGGADLALNNIVEIYISDIDTQTYPLGHRLIYKGYISMIQPVAIRSRQGIQVHLLGMYTLLGVDILKNGTTTTLNTDTTTGLTTGAASAADIGLVMRAVIDRYVAEISAGNSPQISYNTMSIPLTGTTATYKFEGKTYREAVDKVKELAPSDYFWYIDETGILTFKGKSATATHSFYVSKHVVSLEIQQSMEKIRNFILVYDGTSLYKHYQDDSSINLYGRRVERIVNYGVAASSAADAVAAKFLAENKDPQIVISAEIMDNNGGDGTRGYDIESIQPGDTCSFFDYNDTLSSIFKENMVITSVDYFFDRARIQVEISKSGLLDWQEQTAEQLDDTNLSGLPTSYT